MSSSIKSKFIIGLSAFVLLASGGVLFNGCKSKTANTSAGLALTGDTIKDGEMLAAKYCTSCHKLVPAGALTKDVSQCHYAKYG